MKKVRYILTAFFAVFAFMMALAAQAAPVYGNIGPPGVFFGTGNVNGNFWSNTSNGVEVGIRAKNRATLATIDGADGVYEVAQGLCNPVCSGGNKSKLNYEISVNTHAPNGMGAGTLDLTQVFVQLLVDIDPGLGVIWNPINVLANWADNEYWNGTSKRVGTLATYAPVAGEFVVQQSANTLFGNAGFFGILPGPGLYDFKLNVYDLTNRAKLLSSVQTQVKVVPEPGSLALFGLGAIGLFVSRRKTTSKDAFPAVSI